MPINWCFMHLELSMLLKIVFVIDVNKICLRGKNDVASMRWCTMLQVVAKVDVRSCQLMLQLSTCWSTCSVSVDLWPLYTGLKLSSDWLSYFVRSLAALPADPWKVTPTIWLWPQHLPNDRGHLVVMVTSRVRETPQGQMVVCCS